MGVTGENDLFPVKGTWHVSSYILIHLFHISLHKSRSEKEGGREGGRQTTERLNVIEGQFEFASGYKRASQWKDYESGVKHFIWKKLRLFKARHPTQRALESGLPLL